jgi:hypothetical protein
LELPVQPGDLIIAATHRHWHCNVRKRVGRPLFPNQGPDFWTCVQK